MQPNKPRTSAPAGEAPQSAETSVQSPAGAEAIVDPSLRAAVARRAMEAAAAQATAEAAPVPEETEAGAEDEPAPSSDLEDILSEVSGKTAEAVRKYEGVRVRIEAIKEELEASYYAKEEAAATASKCEAEVENVSQEIAGLEADLGSYQAAVRETGQTLAEKLKQGLNLIKDILKGDNKAIRKTLQEAMSANDQNEAAKNNEKATTEKLGDAYKRRDDSQKDLDEAKKTEFSADAKIRALENELEQRQTEAAILESEIGIRIQAEERAAERDRIKAELAEANLSVSDARRRLIMDRATVEARYAEKEARFKQFAEEDLPFLTEYLGISVEGHSEEVLQARFDKLREERDAEIAKIDSNLDALDEYFPSFKERVRGVLQNASLKNALGAMRRKNVIKNIRVPEARVGERVQPSAEEALAGIDPDKRDTVAA